jgi:hypothetical protein
MVITDPCGWFLVRAEGEGKEKAVVIASKFTPIRPEMIGGAQSNLSVASRSSLPP